MASSSKSDKEQDSSKEIKDLKPDTASTTDREPETGASKDVVMEEDHESGITSTWSNQWWFNKLALLTQLPFQF